jgi:uncharacterized protein DUF4126
MESGAPVALLAVALGLGLAAATGLRVFVPLLALSIGAAAGWVQLAPGFTWLGSTTALVTLASATVFEVLGYYLPWVDHLLDIVATPAAVLAGTLVMASVLPDLPPIVRAALALIAGGGAAGVVQGATVVARLKSTALTGGLGNPVLATAELAGAVLGSVLALLAPLLALALLAALCATAFVLGGRFVFGRRRPG